MAKKNDGFAVLVIVTVMFIVIVNLFILPQMVIRKKNTEASNQLCNNFCSDYRSYELVYQTGKGSYSCSCADDRGVIMARTFYPPMYS